MGKASKDKGYRGENNFVKLMQSHGIGAERMPLSGALGGEWAGDVKVYTTNEELKLEGKVRGNGFKSIYKWISPANIDGLFIKADREDYLVVLKMSTFIALINETEHLN